MSTSQQTILPGFQEPVHDGQQTFRQVLHALSRPGEVVTISLLKERVSPLYIATSCLVLTLVDFETPLWIDNAGKTKEVLTYLAFHCGCPIADKPAEAAFAIITDPQSMPSLKEFHPGTPEYPDRSTTIFIQVESLSQGKEITLKGPGIEKDQLINVQGVEDKFWKEVQRNSTTFPLGVDLFLMDEHQLVGIPRTTKVEI